MKRVVLTTAALVAAVVVWALLLPPRRLALPREWDDGTVRGILHVHSRLSDGRGTMEDIAHAAARAGLAFVVVTDHGDATRPPAPPTYVAGVLVIDAVEISTNGGHYVAIGMPAAPYPLGGDARDVVEDVRRLGGFGIAAHPDSPKSELRWSDWEQAPVDAIELINPDTSWRVHAFAGDAGSRLLLFRALLTYPARPSESIAQLLTDSAPLTRRWQGMATTRPVVGLAGADAHAKLALRNTEPGDNRLSVPMPSYEASFNALSVHVTPMRPLAGNAAEDAASLIDGLRSGHAFVAVDGWATPAAFSFTATSGSAVASQGDVAMPGPPMTLHVRSNAPVGFTTTIWRGLEPVVRDRTEPTFDLDVDGTPAVYTAEIRRASGRGEPPWIISNPIYVRQQADPAPSTGTSPVEGEGAPLFDGRTTAGWSFEQDPTSVAVVEATSLVDGPRLRLRYGLAGGARVGQYAAAAVELPREGVEAFRGVAFRLRAERPMRVSIQVRSEPPGAQPARWQRSVYADATERSYVVPFGEMRPVGGSQGAAPLASLRALMFVVDTTNTSPGASGRLWIGRPVLVR